jgi:hypothetical protein
MLPSQTWINVLASNSGSPQIVIMYHTEGEKRKGKEKKGEGGEDEVYDQ